MPKRVESGQVAFNECHQAKPSGATDIQQSSISSDHNAKKNFVAAQVSTQWSEHAKNFGAAQVFTQWLEHAKNVQGSQPSRGASKELYSTTNQSAVQVMTNLTYRIPKVIHQVIVKTTLKDNAEATTRGKEWSKVEVNEDGFKIPQGTAHHSQKRLEADERRKLVDTILKRDLDLSDYLVNVMKVSH